MGNFHPNVFKENIGLTVERGSKAQRELCQGQELLSRKRPWFLVAL